MRSLKSRIGANIHYALEQEGEYIKLDLNREKCVVSIKESEDKTKNKIITGLQKLKTLVKNKNNNKISFEKIL